MKQTYLKIKKKGGLHKFNNIISSLAMILPYLLNKKQKCYRIYMEKKSMPDEKGSG